MILLSDRRVAAVQLGDTGEALFDGRTVADLRWDSRLADAAGAYAHLREGVVERLLRAQRLLPGGLRLLLVEGYRPLSMQAWNCGELIVRRGGYRPAMRWMEFANEQPRLAELARARLLGPGVVLVCTIRGDGTPRLSPVEPFIMDGELWLSMLWGSWKAKDLLRDPRILVHNIVTSREGGPDGEMKLRGTARPVEDHAVQVRYAAAVAEAIGWNPTPGRFHLFAVDVADVAYLHYDHDTGDQFTALWPRGAEFVRRGTSATSVGDPEPVGDPILAQ